MSDTMLRTSLGEPAARNLADVTKTAPQMGAISPRWLLRMLPWVDVDAGLFRVNKVRVRGEEFHRVETRVEGERALLEPEALRAIPLFSGLAAELLAEVAGAFGSRQFAAGAAIVNEGEDGDEMFIISRGEVEVSRATGGGGRAVIARRQEGEFFGELALLDSRPRSASVRALTPTLLLVLPRATLATLAQRHPQLLVDLRDASRQRGGAGSKAELATSTTDGEPIVQPTWIDYEEEPLELALSSIITVLRVHTRVMDLYKKPFDQLREQARLVVEAMKERQEWELINNPEFGLASKTARSMRASARSGPPTPDDMDALLARVWKEPSFFLAHPLAIAAFGRECTSRGVPPPTASLLGSNFLTWRGVPIIPSDKIAIDPRTSVPTTRIFLIRAGQERRGVIGLHQPNIGDERLPSFAIRFNGVDEKGIGNYLVSLYFSLALLADDAAGSLDNVVIGNHREYRS